MVRGFTEEFTFHYEGINHPTQFKRNVSGPMRYYGDHSLCESTRFPGLERDVYDRRSMRGNRSASLERVPMQIMQEGAYGPQRGFYGGPHHNPRDKTIGYGYEKMYGYGGMGGDVYDSTGRPSYRMDYGRFPTEGSRDFGGYNLRYGEPFHPPDQPKHLEYEDRYSGGHDRSRRGDYYGMGSSSRRSYSCAPSGNLYGPPAPILPANESRDGYSGH